MGGEEGRSMRIDELREEERPVRSLVRAEGTEIPLKETILRESTETIKGAILTSNLRRLKNY